MNHKNIAIAILIAASIVACAHPPATTITAQEKNEKSLPVWTANCHGAPPSGDLYAQRIVSANSNRQEAGLYEGPVWIKDALYFSDFSFAKGFPSRIQRLDLAGVMNTVIEDSGSNGLAVDHEGNIIAATHNTKSLSRFHLVNHSRDTVVGQYDGKVFNSPNDVAVASDGSMYFTDPDFQRDAAPGGQEKTRVYHVSNDSRVAIVDDTLTNPNGVSLSPDESHLYVNGNGEHGVLRRYSIKNGTPQNGQDWVSGLTYPDGMTVDCHGNVYVAEHTLQRIRVFSAEGKQLAVIHVDANVTNVAFGGIRGTTLYITGAGVVWKIDLDVAGSPY